MPQKYHHPYYASICVMLIATQRQYGRVAECCKARWMNRWWINWAIWDWGRCGQSKSDRHWERQWGWCCAKRVQCVRSAMALDRRTRTQERSRSWAEQKRRQARLPNDDTLFWSALNSVSPPFSTATNPFDTCWIFYIPCTMPYWMTHRAETKCKSM